MVNFSLINHKIGMHSPGLTLMVVIQNGDYTILRQNPLPEGIYKEYKEKYSNVIDIA